MLYVCISFDYELFMGKNYVTEKEVLIEPTEKLYKMLSWENMSATFFADVCCPMRYRDFGENEFPKMFDEQLKALARNGQDVQLHIHPHWLKATQIGAEVKFDRTYYRIHNWAENGHYESVERIIQNGVDYLNGVMKLVQPDYRCVAFRAGGYCLQPEEKLIPILYDAGIRIDSSVCRGFAHDGDGMYYDYKTFPKVNNCYLNSTYGLKDAVQGKIEKGVFEVPVGGYTTFPFRPLASKLNAQISMKQANGYGMSLENAVVKPANLFERLKRIRTATNMLTFDFYNSKSMTFMLNRIAQEETCKNRDVFISIISHPKGMTDDHIENMKQSIDQLKRNPYVAFVSMRDIADMQGLI